MPLFRLSSMRNTLSNFLSLRNSHISEMLSQSLKPRTRFWHYISAGSSGSSSSSDCDSDGTGQDYGSKTGKQTKQKPEEQEKVGEMSKSGQSRSAERMR